LFFGITARSVAAVGRGFATRPFLAGRRLPSKRRGPETPSGRQHADLLDLSRRALSGSARFERLSRQENTVDRQPLWRRPRIPSPPVEHSVRRRRTRCAIPPYSYTSTIHSSTTVRCPGKNTPPVFSIFSARLRAITNPSATNTRPATCILATLEGSAHSMNELNSILSKARMQCGYRL